MPERVARRGRTLTRPRFAGTVRRTIIRRPVVRPPADTREILTC